MRLARNRGSAVLKDVDISVGHEHKSMKWRFKNGKPKDI